MNLHAAGVARLAQEVGRENDAAWAAALPGRLAALQDEWANATIRYFSVLAALPPVATMRGEEKHALAVLCENCGELKGSAGYKRLCRNCYEYRRKHGADRPWLLVYRALRARHGVIDPEVSAAYSVSEEMGIPVGEVRGMIASAVARLGLPAVGAGEHRRAAMRRLAARTGYASEIAFRSALRRLNDRERELLALQYGLRPGDVEGRPPASIAREWGVQRQRIHQIHAAALAKLVRARERGERGAGA